MRSETKLVTTVQSGGRIEVVAPDLSPGATVEVVIRAATPPGERRSALDILSEAPGHRLFKTAEDVDAYVRQERESWDR